MQACSSIGKSRITAGLHQPANVILSPGGRSTEVATLKGCQLTPKVCITTPLKASMRRMKLPLVEMRMSLPSLLNLSPVHSQVRSYCILKVANGPWNDKDSGPSPRPISVPSARANSHSLPLDFFLTRKRRGRTIAPTFSNVYHIPPLGSHLTLQNFHNTKIAQRLKDFTLSKERRS